MQPRKLSFRDTLLGDGEQSAHTIEDSFEEYYDESYEDLDEEDDEDYPIIRVSKDHFLHMCAPWKGALVIKLLGKNLRYHILVEQIKVFGILKGQSLF